MVLSHPFSLWAVCVASRVVAWLTHPLRSKFRSVVRLHLPSPPATCARTCQPYRVCACSFLQQPNTKTQSRARAGRARAARDNLGFTAHPLFVKMDVDAIWFSSADWGCTQSWVSARAAAATRRHIQF